jgi:hypothetical protein
MKKSFCGRVSPLQDPAGGRTNIKSVFHIVCLNVAAAGNGRIPGENNALKHEEDRAKEKEKEKQSGKSPEKGSFEAVYPDFRYSYRESGLIFAGFSVFVVPRRKDRVFQTRTTAFHHRCRGHLIS